MILGTVCAFAVFNRSWAHYCTIPVLFRNQLCWFESQNEHIFFLFAYILYGAHRGAVGWGTALQVGRSQVRIPMMSLEFCNWHNPSGRTMALGSTQPLTEMSTRNISWVGKGGRCVGLTTLPLSCADCLEIWEPQPTGTLWACPGL